MGQFGKGPPSKFCWVRFGLTLGVSRPKGLPWEGESFRPNITSDNGNSPGRKGHFKRRRGNGGPAALQKFQLGCSTNSAQKTGPTQTKGKQNRGPRKSRLPLCFVSPLRTPKKGTFKTRLSPQTAEPLRFARLCVQATRDPTHQGSRFVPLH